MYSLLRSLLFQLDAEKAHDFSMHILRVAGQTAVLPHLLPALPQKEPTRLMGLTFPNRIGLAAGLDKAGNTIDALGDLGFGFIEIGTITPRPQSGNERPRLFRLRAQEAIINRMGFNNPGAEAAVENVRATRRYSGVIGFNIGKNKHTPNEHAAADYSACLEQAYGVADYITVNLSSPNTPGLRDLQNADESARLLARLRREQEQLSLRHGRHVPIAFKVAPDLHPAHIEALAEVFVREGLECLIATNTTLSRRDVESNPLHHEAGGLSGPPVRDMSTAVIAQFASHMGSRVPIIGVGGISSVQDAQAKFAAGASLVQLYTSFIYHGPPLVRALVRALG